MSRQVLYVSGGSALSRLFERALKPLGYDELIYLPEFWRGLSELKQQGVRVRTSMQQAAHGQHRITLVIFGVKFNAESSLNCFCQRRF